jgi:MFS family permease
MRPTPAVQFGMFVAISLASNSLPNIFMALVGGVLVDRFNARSVTVATAAICLVGAILTAMGSQFPVMAAGRLLFGLGAETIALNISVSRFGSYLATPAGYASMLWFFGLLSLAGFLFAAFLWRREAVQK